MLYKHNLELEKIKLKNGPDPVDPTSVSSRPWRQEDITKLLNESCVDEEANDVSG